MDNKLQKTGQNSLMDNFVKTDDILNDMCGIIESSQKSCISGGQYNTDTEKLAAWVSNCRSKTLMPVHGMRKMPQNRIGVSALCKEIFLLSIIIVCSRHRKKKNSGGKI